MLREVKTEADYIVNIVKEKGTISIDELSEKTKIEKDILEQILSFLQDQGLIRTFYKLTTMYIEYVNPEIEKLKKQEEIKKQEFEIPGETGFGKVNIGSGIGKSELIKKAKILVYKVWLYEIASETKDIEKIEQLYSKFNSSLNEILPNINTQIQDKITSLNNELSQSINKLRYALSERSFLEYYDIINQMYEDVNGIYTRIEEIINRRSYFNREDNPFVNFKSFLIQDIFENTQKEVLIKKTNELNKAVLEEVVDKIQELYDEIKELFENSEFYSEFNEKDILKQSEESDFKIGIDSESKEIKIDNTKIDSELSLKEKKELLIQDKSLLENSNRYFEDAKKKYDEFFELKKNLEKDHPNEKKSALDQYIEFLNSERKLKEVITLLNSSKKAFNQISEEFFLIDKVKLGKKIYTLEKSVLLYYLEVNSYVVAYKKNKISEKISLLKDYAANEKFDLFHNIYIELSKEIESLDAINYEEKTTFLITLSQLLNSVKRRELEVQKQKEKNVKELVTELYSLFEKAKKKNEIYKMYLAYTKMDELVTTLKESKEKYSLNILINDVFISLLDFIDNYKTKEFNKIYKIIESVIEKTEQKIKEEDFNSARNFYKLINPLLKRIPSGFYNEMNQIKKRISNLHIELDKHLNEIKKEFL